MKALIFFIAVIVVLAIAYSSSKEGFRSKLGIELTNKNEGTPSNCNSQESSHLSPTRPQVPIAQLGVGNIQPGPAPASDLPSAPIGFISKETPSPYRNPINEPAKYIRLLAVKEDLQAFFGFESGSLSNKSDSSIQIPLTRARADLNEILDIQSVMERNPGLPSRINNKQLDDIKSNLNYLRQTSRDLDAAGIGGLQEGFKNRRKKRSGKKRSGKKRSGKKRSGKKRSGKKSSKKRSGKKRSGKKSSKKRSGKKGSGKKSLEKKFSEEPQYGNIEHSTHNLIDHNIKPSKRATLKELQAFQIKLVVELKRLGASGTSDPLIQGRINTLTNIKNEVDEVITKLDRGILTPQTVPIYQEDIIKSLPILGQPNSPLPKLLNKFSLPPAIASLFPGGLSPKDSEQATQINNIASGYLKNLFEGASWGVNLNFKYDNPNKSKSNCSACQRRISQGLTGQCSTCQRSTSQRSTSQRSTSQRSRENKNSINHKNPPAVKHITTYGIPGVKKCLQPVQDSMRINHTTDTTHTPGLPGVSNRTYPKPISGEFDWQKRSKEILKQVKKRGLNPVQFGALPKDVQVSSDFSWRGYTRMICLRLNATTDPGLAFSCGCPHENWEGWRT